MRRRACSSCPRRYYGLDSLLVLLAFHGAGALEVVDRCATAPRRMGQAAGLIASRKYDPARQRFGLLAPKPASRAMGVRRCRSAGCHAAPEQAGTLYVDGTWRVYNGDQTSCRVTMWRASACACVPPPTTGSMHGWSGPSSSSIRPSIPASSGHRAGARPTLEREVPASQCRGPGAQPCCIASPWF